MTITPDRDTIRPTSGFGAVRRRKAGARDLGQTGIVAVVAFSVLAALIGAVIVQTIVTSDPLLQGKAVEIYAHRAAGRRARTPI